jgi:hypothetical protein
VGAIVLACGGAGGAGGLPIVTDLLTERENVELRTAPAQPGKAEVDPLLGELGDRRLVVIGADGDLAAVVLRLLRTERLADVVVGFVPTSSASEVALTWDLPTDFGRAVDVALGGDADRVPLVRDDQGGILVGLGTIGPLRGVGYCDDERVLRGPAKLIRVSPASSGPGLDVLITHRGLFNRRTKSYQGRAFELGCLPTRVTSDGIPRAKPVKRWNWYRHTEDLRLARGL